MPSICNHCKVAVRPHLVGIGVNIRKKGVDLDKIFTKGELYTQSINKQVKRDLTRSFAKITTCIVA